MLRSLLRATRAVAVSVGWLIVLCWAVAIGARLVAWDQYEPGIVFDALGAVTMLPVLAVLIGGAALRRWFLVAAALAVGAATLWLALPEVAARQSLPPAARPEVALRVLDGNVDYFNKSMAGYAHLVAATSPDLVTFEEAPRGDLEQLVSDGALRSLPYRAEAGDGRSFNFVVASRYPFGALRPVLDEEGTAFAVETTLVVGGRHLQLVVVHTRSPRPGAASIWRSQLRQLARSLAPRAGPVVVIGDFNATWGSRGFRDILDDGLVDGAAARGQPLEMTWSQLLAVLPPFVRIDHILTRGGPVVRSVTAVTGPGSDHRALTAVVSVS